MLIISKTCTSDIQMCCDRIKRCHTVHFWEITHSLRWRDFQHFILLNPTVSQITATLFLLSVVFQLRITLRSCSVSCCRRCTGSWTSSLSSAPSCDSSLLKASHNRQVRSAEGQWPLRAACCRGPQRVTPGTRTTPDRLISSRPAPIKPWAVLLLKLTNCLLWAF